jgi:hypothetical protein
MTTYEIQVIQKDRDGWLAELREAVAAELLAVGLHRTVAVLVAETIPDPDVPSTAVYLGSPSAAGAADLADVAVAALGAGRVVIPVVDDLAAFGAQVPSALRPVNGFEWSGADPSRALARLLLVELGIEERQRRVFISHKRDDGLAAAEQLHDALTHRGFAPFIDRFAIPRGRDVQARIADALEDHAFLMLLETPLAHTSDWVFDEVDYALSHTMGTLILRWPGDVTAVPGSNDLPRLSLSATDIAKDAHNYDVLTEGALDHVIEAVEAAHARGLVRRRRMLVQSIEEAAKVGGASSCVPLPDWRLLVEHGSASTLLGVTPRLPTASDLQLLDDARAAVSAGSSAVLVHSARALRQDLSEHLTWVAGDRDLELTPENAIGSRWQ